MGCAREKQRRGRSFERHRSLDQFSTRRRKDGLDRGYLLGQKPADRAVVVVMRPRAVPAFVRGVAVRGALVRGLLAAMVVISVLAARLFGVVVVQRVRWQVRVRRARAAMRMGVHMQVQGARHAARDEVNEQQQRG